MKNNKHKKKYIIAAEIICVIVVLVLLGIKNIIANNLPESYIGYGNICKIHRLTAVNYISNLLCSIAVFFCTFIPFGSRALFLLKIEFKYPSSFSVARAAEAIALLIV